MDISAKNLQKRIPLNLKPIPRIVTAILRETGIGRASLSFVFVSSQKMRSLNKKYLRHNYVTDILTFDLREGRAKGRELSGDIVICAEKARTNARHFKTSFNEELILYLIHGVLHLLGYNDHQVSEKKQMREKEKELLSWVIGNLKQINIVKK